MVSLRLFFFFFMYFFFCYTKNNGYPPQIGSGFLSQSGSTIITYLGQTGMMTYGSFNETFGDLIIAKLLPATKNNPNCKDIQVSSSTGMLSLSASSGCIAAICPLYIDILNIFGYSLKQTGNHNFFGFMFIFQKQM
ncbi:hypothetical protein HW132_35625 [Brasilonema sp. CT11]|nr:hypothetical protein [Brasilonema sp. CT11]